MDAVFAAGGVQASGRFEDHASIMMMLANGATGLVEANWLTPMKIRKLSLTCSRSSRDYCFGRTSGRGRTPKWAAGSQRFVEVDYMNQTVDVSSSTAMDVDTSDLSQIPQEHDHRHITLKKQEPLKNELVDFLDANCGLREEPACFRGLWTDCMDKDLGIERKRKPLVGGEDGVEAVRMARAALESIRQRRVIEMEKFEV